MSKVFRFTGNCILDQYYMIDLTSRLYTTRDMVDTGKYIVLILRDIKKIVQVFEN